MVIVMDMEALVNLGAMVPEMIILDQYLISTPSIAAQWSVLKVQPRVLSKPVYSLTDLRSAIEAKHMGRLYGKKGEKSM